MSQIVVVHNGARKPQLGKDVDDVAWFGMAWDYVLTGTLAIESSYWLVPVGGPVIENHFTDQPLAVQDMAYAHVNLVLLSGGELDRLYPVTNRVRFSDGQTLDYSFLLKAFDR